MFLPPSFRLLGAEINSILAMTEKEIINSPLERLILLVSDTDTGRQVGEILTSYFLNKNSPLPCINVEIKEIKKLQDNNPRDFQREGLPNLVRMLGDITKEWTPQVMAINATGGYKAQIAFAVLFGQAMSIPVYYKHEFFNEIISFPTVPFTMDLSPIKNNLRFWANLAEKDALLSYNEVQKLGTPDQKDWEAVRPLLDSISENDEQYYSLSALGLIYWEAFCAQNSSSELEPPKAKKNSGCDFRDDHYPKGFKEWGQKINAQYSFITGCHSLPYDGQRGMKPGVYEDRGKIIAVYEDHNNFAARLEILTTCTNALERNYVLRVMNEK